MDQKEVRMDFTTGNIVSLSLGSFKANFGFYSLLGIFFIVLSALILTLIPEGPSINWTLTIVLITLFSAVYAKFAVTIHRSILLNEFSFNDILNWTNNNTQFLLWIISLFLLLGAIVFGILFLIMPLVSANTPSPAFGFLAIIAMVVLAILVSRLIIIFPSIAVGKKLSLSECWQLTGQYKASMFGIVIGFPYLTNILLKFIPNEGLIWTIVGTAISIIISIFEIIMISHAYNALVEKKPNSEPDELRL